VREDCFGTSSHGDDMDKILVSNLLCDSSSCSGRSLMIEWPKVFFDDVNGLAIELALLL
jgi:hypothetical protein